MSLEFDDFAPFLYVCFIGAISMILLLSIWQQKFQIISTMIISIVFLYKLYELLSYRSRGQP